jgi:putative transcriptional regulator
MIMVRKWLGGLAALAILWCAAPAFAEDDELAPGKLLVADRKLKDPNFAGTVILLVTYDDEGSVGLVLNRQSDVPISALLAGVKAAASRQDTAFSGGPVELDSILALARSPKSVRGARHLTGQIYAILNQKALEETLNAGAGPESLRLYVGYAGWGPGQLDAEVDAGAWHIRNADTNTVFDTDPDTLWERLSRRTDQFIAQLIARPGQTALRFRRPSSSIPAISRPRP